MNEIDPPAYVEVDTPWFDPQWSADHPEKCAPRPATFVVTTVLEVLSDV